MWKTSSMTLLLLSVFHSNISWSSDACSTQAITAAADVTVSDGSSFQIETSFQSRDVSAIRHIRDPQQWIVVAGPHSWTQLGDTASIATDIHNLLAIRKESSKPVVQMLTFQLTLSLLKLSCTYPCKF